MPTSVTGNDIGRRVDGGVADAAVVRHQRVSPAMQARRRRASGFTLIELLIVIAIVVVAAGVISMALRDSNEAKLEEEGARLAALLEMARAEARVSGSGVQWVPVAAGSTGVDPNVQFRFVGLSMQSLPARWLDAHTTAQVVGSTMLVLGPDAILPPQRVVLLLGDKRLELASDGLAPFAVAQPASAATP